MIRPREAGLFLLCSVLICLAVFRGAFWGSRILAPVDIAPTLFSKYRYIDLHAGNVPANHYIVDQLTYDLPLQHTIYETYRRAEIPWWDPYTYAGRPLMADAHVNGTDPIRLICYLTLPFVPAYNWNLILKSILTGFGMFLLLRHLRFAIPISLPLALTYQFAGCFAVFFGHPWIQASFAYYPFLWMIWSLAAQKPLSRLDAAGAGLCALIFYSGNLQSHAYLLLFSLCALIGSGFFDRILTWRIFRSITFSVLIGAALAAPVLWPQVEFYINSIRASPLSPTSAWSYLAGTLSLSTIFPWGLGTFRTLDISKAFGVHAAGFVVFIGSAAFLLAMLGCRKSELAQLEQKGARRTAIALVLAYFIVCSTPLLGILYIRMAPIAVIGLILLAAFGLNSIADRDRPLKKLSWMIAGTAVAIVLALNLAAFVVYPRFIERVHAFVAAHDKTNASLDQTPALRSFQVENLPREISLLNPETGAAFLGLIALALYLRRARPAPFAQLILLTLNFLPVIFFFSRYVPNQPVSYWERLLAGGPEQQRVAAALNPAHLRLLEKSPGLNEMLFPNNMGHLQKVHAVHGYSALQPVSLYHWPFKELPPPELVANFVYRSDTRGEEAGQFTQISGSGNSRLQCVGREIAITNETLNTLSLSIGSGPNGVLFRTDTFYPGWQVQLNGKQIPLARGTGSFSEVQLPADENSSLATYSYRPTHHVATNCLALIGSVVSIGALLFNRKGNPNGALKK